MQNVSKGLRNNKPAIYCAVPNSCYTKLMDYSEILQSLQQASSFDLYRLKVAISLQLESSERIQSIRDQLSVGQEVEVFNETKNKAEMAIIRKFNPTTVAIILKADQSRWRVPYYWINLEGADVRLRNNAKKGIDRNTLAIGDIVGFRSREGHEVYGEVIRLNPKTVTVETEHGNWRVAYSLLFPVIDSSVINANYITKS